MSHQLIDNLVEVTIKKPDDFLKIKETLTRIGVPSNSTKTIFQTCHILHKQQRLFIVHFKELFLLDGRDAEISDSDLARRNRIVSLLQEWGLVTVVHPEQIEEPRAEINTIKILPFNQKEFWNLVPKYRIGRK